MSEERIAELVWMNRVLAALVVLLAITSGYLLAQKHEWIREQPQTSLEQAY